MQNQRNYGFTYYKKLSTNKDIYTMCMFVHITTNSYFNKNGIVMVFFKKRLEISFLIILKMVDLEILKFSPHQFFSNLKI